MLDYAGGDVIHISAGFAGLASTLLIGKRKIVSENRNETPPPHNVMLVYLGAAILWVGWFGFNAGSAIAANQSASMAMLVCRMPLYVCMPLYVLMHLRTHISLPPVRPPSLPPSL